MSKVSKKIMMVLALSLVFVMIFAGCSSTKQSAIAGGDASAEVTSNGGLAVKQGNYLYYINGLTAVADITDKDVNKFGNVVKGSIMRCELDEHGNMSNNQVLVPLMALSSVKDGGINVFGGWVYYTTPSTAKDKDGNMQTSYLEFMRTSIDGTKTQNIATVDGAGLTYKYTANALIYVANGKITRVNYNDKKVLKEEVIAEDTTSVLLPQNRVYKNEASIDDVIFYTKAAEDEKATYNETFVYDIASSTATKLITGNSYTDSDDKKEQYGISLKNYRVTADGIEVYYEKSNANNPENKGGLFGAMYKDGALDVKNEVRFTIKSASAVYPVSLEKGVYVLENNVLSLMKERVEDGVSKFDDPNKLTLSAGATVVDFIDYNFTGEAVPSVLYSLGNKLYVRTLSDADHSGRAKVVSDNEYSINSTWLAPEIIDGNIYFFNTSFYSYLDVMNIATGEMAKADGKLTHPLAKLNDVDTKAEADKAKAEKENK